MATVKATAFRGYRNYLTKTLSPTAYEELIGRFSDPLREIFRQEPIMVSRSYPIELQHEFMEHCRKLWPLDHGAHLVRMGRTVAETDLTGIYKVIIKIASVEMTLRVLTSAWKNYFSDGRAELVKEDTRCFTFTITDHFHHPLHYYIVEGYVQVAIELAGGVEAEAHFQQTERKEVVRYLVRWKTKSSLPGPTTALQP